VEVAEAGRKMVTRFDTAKELVRIKEAASMPRLTPHGPGCRAPEPPERASFRSADEHCATERGSEKISVSNWLTTLCVPR
jgi:hypothetical protein